jgi:hypothetical protein
LLNALNGWYRLVVVGLKEIDEIDEIEVPELKVELRLRLGVGLRLGLGIDAVDVIIYCSILYFIIMYDGHNGSFIMRSKNQLNTSPLFI